MDEKTLIAVASSDGRFVNDHFGRAKKFDIYEMFEDDVSYVETREVDPACKDGDHSDDRINLNLDALSDCSYLLVSRIGDGALRLASSRGIEAYEIPGEIPDSIEQMIKYIKIKELFK